MPDASSTLMPYEAPYISRIRHQLQAKGSLPLAAAALGHRTEIDGVDLDSLTREQARRFSSIPKPPLNASSTAPQADTAILSAMKARYEYLKKNREIKEIQALLVQLK